MPFVLNWEETSGGRAIAFVNALLIPPRAHLGGGNGGDIFVGEFFENGCLAGVVKPKNKHTELLLFRAAQLL